MISLLSDIPTAPDPDDELDTDELDDLIGAALELADAPEGIAVEFHADYDKEVIQLSWDYGPDGASVSMVFEFSKLRKYLNK